MFIILFSQCSDILSLPTLKQFIYISLSACLPEQVATDSSALMEAMMNVMQATCVTLQSSGHTLDGDILYQGKQTFCALFSRYFKDTMLVRGKGKAIQWYNQEGGAHITCTRRSCDLWPCEGEGAGGGCVSSCEEREAKYMSCSPFLSTMQILLAERGIKSWLHH